MASLSPPSPPKRSQRAADDERKQAEPEEFDTGAELREKIETAQSALDDALEILREVEEIRDEGR